MTTGETSTGAPRFARDGVAVALWRASLEPGRAPVATARLGGGDAAAAALPCDGIEGEQPGEERARLMQYFPCERKKRTLLAAAAGGIVQYCNSSHLLRNVQPRPPFFLSLSFLLF